LRGFFLNRFLDLFKDWLSNGCKRFFCHDRFLWSGCWSRRFRYYSRLLNGFLNLLFNLDRFILNNFKGSF